VIVYLVRVMFWGAFAALILARLAYLYL